MGCKKKTRVSNLVIVSDLHCGCQLGLCPAEGIVLDEAGGYEPSPLQKIVWACWREFWDVWVPEATRGEPFAVLVNGDSLDGRHHGSVTQISQNLAVQSNIAKAVLKPIKDLCDGRLYMTRGTEAHVGASAEAEEQLAVDLKAVPDEYGRRSRYELWGVVGKGLVHASHHIGITGSSHYESSAVMKELSELYAEAGRWRNRPPDVVVRSHRHRHLEVRVPTSLGYGISFTTAGWQLKTPFVYKIPGGRITMPQIGGSLIRQGDEDLFTRHRTWTIPRPKVEIL